MHYFLDLLPTRLLLIDDEPDMVMIMKKALPIHGFTLVAYTDPTKAFSEFKPDQYDLVVIDYSMPKIDGIKLYGKLAIVDSKPKYVVMSASGHIPTMEQRLDYDLTNVHFIY